MRIWITVKGVSQKNTVTKVPYDYPHPPSDVENLIQETVKLCVASYNERAENQELLGVLSKEAIEAKAPEGKISFGVNYGGRKADPEKAVRNALQCFEDGLVAVFVDGKRKVKREERIELKEGSELTFVRLTFLSGRMW